MSKAVRNLFIVMVISLGIASLWNRIPLIKETVHALLNPTAGALLSFNVNLGVIVFSAVISLMITIVQKYTTDQETLREIKKEQKILQAQMKEFKDNPQKLLELQKKQLEFIPRTMEITFRPLMYTSLPIILFFRWFNDYFADNPVKVFGFMHWLLAYIIFSMIFTTIFRKVFKVA